MDKWVFEVKITIEHLKQEKTISEQHIKEKEHVLLVKINYVEDEHRSFPPRMTEIRHKLCTGHFTVHAQVANELIIIIIINYH